MRIVYILSPQANTTGKITLKDWKKYNFTETLFFLNKQEDINIVIKYFFLIKIFFIRNQTIFLMIIFM